MNTTQMVLTEEKADLYDAALDHVNDVRKEMGLSPLTELLPGVPVDSFQCPVSNSILSGIDGYSCTSYGTTTVYDRPVFSEDHEVVVRSEMSDLSKQFQRAFDDGQFPELIAE